MKKFVVSFGIVLCVVLLVAVIDVLIGYTPKREVTGFVKAAHVMTHCVGGLAIIILVVRSWLDQLR